MNARYSGTSRTFASAQGGVTARLFRKSGQYRVRTDGPEGRSGEFPIAYTLGVEPLQQYLLPQPGGRFQVLGVAWDSRPRAAGGRRWFAPLPEVVGHRHPLHWTKPSQTWNSGCAECHSTNVRKGFRPRDNLFVTTFSEIDVACEACHGAGSRHVEWARAARSRGRSAGKDPGLIVRFSERRERRWEMDDASGTARLGAEVDAASEVETCARCHATRKLLSEDATPGRLLQQSHRPSLLEEGLYFADGQAQDEPYTWGSFVQSRMHAAGVRCVDCHDAHDLKLSAEGDAVCLACHAPAALRDPSPPLPPRGRPRRVLHRLPHERAEVDGRRQPARPFVPRAPARPHGQPRRRAGPEHLQRLSS